MDDRAVDQNVPKLQKPPLTFLLAKWYGYVFSMFFLLYGGVNLILGILDRDTSATPKSIVFLILGIILTTVCVGYRDRRVWGWYGLVGVNGLVVIGALIGYSEALNFIYLILSAACLGLLFAPRTKAQIF